jgi:hypothetical protein
VTFEQSERQQAGQTSFVHGLRFRFSGGFAFNSSCICFEVTTGLHFSMRLFPIVNTFTKAVLLDDANGEPEGFNSPGIEFMNFYLSQNSKWVRAVRANSEKEGTNGLSIYQEGEGAYLEKLWKRGSPRSTGGKCGQFH